MLWLLVFVSTALFAGEWQVEKSDKNLVKFISDAPIEDFEGVTSEIDGYIFWEGDNLLEKSELYFEVNLNALDTGIGLRNRHMRENYLETKLFPTTWFKGKCTKVTPDGENRWKVLVQGTMFIHGKERMKSIEGVIAREGNRLRITSQFGVKLSDYGITIPSIMFYKIDETMQLELNFVLIEPPKEQE